MPMKHDGCKQAHKLSAVPKSSLEGQEQEALMSQKPCQLMLYERMNEDADSFSSFESKLCLFNSEKKMPKRLSRLLHCNFGNYKSQRMY